MPRISPLLALNFFLSNRPLTVVETLKTTFEQVRNMKRDTRKGNSDSDVVKPSDDSKLH